MKNEWQNLTNASIVTFSPFVSMYILLCIWIITAITGDAREDVGYRDTLHLKACLWEWWVIQNLPQSHRSVSAVFIVSHTCTVGESLLKSAWTPCVGSLELLNQLVRFRDCKNKYLHIMDYISNKQLHGFPTDPTPTFSLSIPLIPLPSPTPCQHPIGHLPPHKRLLRHALSAFV